MKKILKLLAILIIIYLLISAIYIIMHIDFGKEPEIVGMGFSETTNKIRLFMGLPKTHTTYEGVSPIYLIHAVIRIVLGVIISIILCKNNKKTNI